LVGLGLLGVAVGSSALSLGRARGNVVLGQPLSLAVEARVDQADDATEQCFRVEVFHGDTRLDASRVRLVVQPAAAGSQDAVLRIRSSAAIDEPVVGVVLHALCGQGGMRRYDFLPDFPAELRADPVAVAAAPVLAAPAAPAAPAVAASDAAEQPARPAAAAPSPATKAAPRSTGAPAVRAPAVARAQPAPRPTKAPRPAAPKVVAATGAGTTAAAAASTGAARLTLDAPQGRNDGLQPSEALVSGPIDDAAQREAVAAIWRALRTTPEEIVRDRQRLLALEAQQGQQAAQPGTAERELRERLERAERRLDEAENGRVDILLVYGLLALLALVAALAAYFWHRARQASLAAATWGADQPVDAAAVQAGPVAAAPPARSVVAAKASLADEFLGSEPDSAVGAVRSTGVDTDAVAAVVFAHDKPASVDASRPVRPDEFFDVQQHADFFVSLGQYEQAVEVLKQHLDERQDMSPLAFLELFGIYHQLGRKDDFAALRTRFQRRFNARIPSFAAFTDEGLGLEDYPATMLAIETAWGHVRVLDTIEANLSRHPEDTSQPLDLAAYRDLLMLYGVAQDVFVPAGSTRPASGLAPFAASAPMPFAAPAPAPFAAVSRTVGAGAALGAAALEDLTLELDDTDLPQAVAPLPPLDDAAGLELDIDLSTTPAPVAEPPVLSLVEVDIDLPLLDELPDAGSPMPAAAFRAPSKPALDSGLIDFDLFDPNTEARIAPKSTR
jgi:hypothetical protein